MFVQIARLKISVAALLLCFASVAHSVQPTPELADRLHNYRSERGSVEFNEAVKSLPADKETQVQQLMTGMYLIDFGHASPELLEMFMGRKKLSDMTFPWMYNSEGKNAFKGFVDARNFLKSCRSKLSLDVIRRVHALAIPWSDEFGEGPTQLRKNFVYGPEFRDGLLPDQIKSVNANPYLYFLPATGVYADQPQDPEHAQNGDRVRGAIVYPRPRDVKPEILRRLQPQFPDLVERVIEYQTTYGKDYANKSEALTQQLVAAMLTERIQTFEKARAALGELSSKAAEENYVQLIADFQRDVVSIHPFQDGNGRTSRLMLYYLAEREGFPAPRLVYPNEDLFWTPEKWADQVFAGMIATIQLQSALITQIRQQEPLEKSAAFFTPTLPPTNQVKDFEVFIRQRFNSDIFRSRLMQDPVGTMRSMEQDFKR